MGSTHPTGMHPCLLRKIENIVTVWQNHENLPEIDWEDSIICADLFK